MTRNTAVALSATAVAHGNQSGSLESASSLSTSGLSPALSSYCQATMFPAQPTWYGPHWGAEALG
jgi:hypothetical protein